MIGLKYFVYPYLQESGSAKRLARALGGKVLRREGSAFIPRSNRKVINYGASDCPYVCLNPSNFTRIAGNKRDFFQYVASSESPGLGSPRTPRWTTNRAEALAWAKAAGIVARTVLTGHSGAGIGIKDRENKTEISEAPLYVEYIPKDAEYRVHVFKDQQGVPQIIDVQRKVRDPSREPSDWKVRSHANGFIYTRNTSSGESHRTSCPPDVLEQAKLALACSGLTFGAVDVIWNAKKNSAYILEINTAPGLEGTTVQIYADAIRRYYA